MSKKIMSIMSCMRQSLKLLAMPKRAEHMVFAKRNYDTPTTSRHLPLWHSWPGGIVTHAFELQVACSAGCQDVIYCSQACERAAWNAHHAVLCCGASVEHNTARSVPAHCLSQGHICLSNSSHRCNDNSSIAACNPDCTLCAMSVLSLRAAVASYVTLHLQQVCQSSCINLSSLGCLQSAKLCTVLIFVHQVIAWWLKACSSAV